MKAAHKEFIANRFIELCKVKTFKDIKVKDIVEVCGISKQTFYNHFRDKYDLMEYVYTQATAMIWGKFNNPKEEWPDTLTETIEYCSNNKDLFTSLIVYSGQNDFREVFARVCVVFYTEYLQATYQNPLNQETIDAINFYCNGVADFFIKWVHDGMKLTPEEYTARVISFIPQVLYYPLYESLFESENVEP